MPGWVHLFEKLDRSPTHTDRAPEVHLEQSPGVGVGCAFDLAHHGESGIVEYDVETTEDVLGASKGSGNIIWTGDVEGEEEELGGWVAGGEMGENGGCAEGSDDDVAFTEEDLSEGFSEPGGRAGD